MQWFDVIILHSARMTERATMIISLVILSLFFRSVYCFHEGSSNLDDGLFEMPDAGGVNSITLRRFKGRLWPPFPIGPIASVPEFKPRDDDVFILSYPKSGCHWIWEVTRYLLAGDTAIPNMEKTQTMLELSQPSVLEALPAPRALNTHAYFEQMPTEALANPSCKFIYITRDPRDAAVSFYNHHVRLKTFYDYEGRWTDYFPNFLNGKVEFESWFDYTISWEKAFQENPALQVHITSYEALSEDTFEEVGKLANFLGVTTTSSFIADVVEKTSFAYMKKVKGTPDERFIDSIGPLIYRKGKIGDWKNWFTVAQAEEFDDVFEKGMKGTEAYQLYSRLKHDSSEEHCYQN